MTLSGWKFEGGKFLEMESMRHGLLSVAAGSLVTGLLAHIDPVKAVHSTSDYKSYADDSDRTLSEFYIVDGLR